MIRDQHYRAILDRLSTSGLDHDAFERCALDLLRRIYPGLTPVEGGSDLGMDGLDSSDPDAQKILVATTGQNVRRNLLTSLRSHKRQSRSIGARQVVVATTQPATGAVHEDLRADASNEGFQLVNVHGRQAFADLLYGSSRWTRELLGLSGAPPALSAVPVSSRLMSDLPLIGRDSERQWLANSSGDLVISGHPAYGKTHLLRQFVDQGWLFMVDSDRGRLASAVRDSSPEVVVVDDAHADLAGLGSLRQLRTAIDTDFRIAAVTWPGDKDEVADELAVPEGSVLDLRLLTRDEILEVVKTIGVTGSVDLQLMIVNQSGGRPGLTATLCDLAQSERFLEILSGQSLLRQIKSIISRSMIPNGNQVLAVTALAGKSGASVADIQAILGLNAAESQNVMSSLGHTGVFLTSSLRDKVTVWPEELRFAAVGDSFFSPRTYTNLQLAPAIQHLDERSTVGSLVGALLMGAQIPSRTVEQALLRSGSVDDFRHYSLAGEREAAFVLRSKPEWLISIARNSLVENPAETLPLLFDRAIGDYRPQHSHSDHPLRIVKDWVESAQSLGNEQLERRRLLADVAASYGNNGGDSQVVLQALCLAVSPDFEFNRLDPGSGHTGIIQHGIVSQNCLEGLIGLWPAVMKSMPKKDLRDYSAIFDLLRAWIYFGKLHKSPPDTIRQLMRSHASTMASDIAKMYSEHSGVLTLISEMSRRSNLGVSVHIPEPFAVLYPAETSRRDIEAQMENWRNDALRLASDLEPLGPEEVLPMLLDASKRAAEVDRTWPDLTEEVAAGIAHRTDDPLAWAQCALDLRLGPKVAGPLLWTARQSDRHLTLPTMIRALATENIKSVAVRIVLASDDPLDVEMQTALDLIGQHAELAQDIETLVALRKIPTHIIRRLLGHPSQDIAEIVAVHLWNQDGDPHVPVELYDDWRTAILRAPGRSHFILQVFENDPDVFFDWIMTHIYDGSLSESYWITDRLTEAFSKLPISRRIEVLNSIPEQRTFRLSRIVSDLVGDNIAVFERFLSIDHLSLIHQAAFASASLEKIKAALRYGWSNEQIASAILHPSVPFSMMGEESELWRKSCDHFSSLSESSDAEIAAVGRDGYVMAQANLDAALSRERNEDVYGH